MSKDVSNRDYITLNKLHVNLQNKYKATNENCKEKITSLQNTINKGSIEKKKLNNRIEELEKKINANVEKYRNLFNEYDKLRHKTDPVLNENNHKDNFNKIKDEYNKINSEYLEKQKLLNEKNQELQKKVKEIENTEKNVSKKLVTIKTSKREIKYNYEDYLTKKNINRLLYILCIVLSIILICLVFYKFRLYEYFILKM